MAASGSLLHCGYSATAEHRLTVAMPVQRCELRLLRTSRWCNENSSCGRPIAIASQDMLQAWALRS